MNLLFDLTADDVFAVYNRLKDKYPLVMTTTLEVDDGFTVDCPILVGKAHGLIVELYEYDGYFVLDVMDEAQTKGTHWHPNDVEMAAADIAELMEGKINLELRPFKQR